MELGSKIKNLRLSCGLTQEELGDRCNVTKGYISQLENDLTSPSIATLVDILNVVGSSLTEFFKEKNDKKIAFKKSDYFEKDSEEQKTIWLIPNSQKNIMEPLLVIIKPHMITTENTPHNGEEFGYVLEGSIVLVFGNSEYSLKKGEAFYFEADKTHYLKNITDKETKIIWISTPPTF